MNQFYEALFTNYSITEPKSKTKKTKHLELEDKKSIKYCFFKNDLTLFSLLLSHFCDGLKIDIYFSELRSIGFSRERVRLRVLRLPRKLSELSSLEQIGLAH